MSFTNKTAPTKRGYVRRWLVATLTLMITSMLGIGQIVSSTPAQAGEGCDLSKGFICGRILNSVGSNSGINVHNGWGSNDHDAGNTQHYTLKPGNWSVYSDTDGYCIPPNVEAYAFIYSAFSIGLLFTHYYPPLNEWRCQKITDDRTAVVFATKRQSKLSTGAKPMSSSPDYATMKAKAKSAAKKKAIAVCKVAKKKAKTQKSKYYKKYKKYFVQCSKLGVKVPKK